MPTTIASLVVQEKQINNPASCALLRLIYKIQHQKPKNLCINSQACLYEEPHQLGACASRPASEGCGGSGTFMAAVGAMERGRASTMYETPSSEA